MIWFILKTYILFIFLQFVLIGNCAEVSFLERVGVIRVLDPPMYFAQSDVYEKLLIATFGKFHGLPSFEHSAGLILIDVSNPQKPVECPRYFSAEKNAYAMDDGPHYSSQIVWPHVYLCGENQLEILRVDDPYAVELIGIYNPEGLIMTGGDLKIVGQKGLLNHGWYAEILDLQNPIAPKRIGGIQLPANRYIDTLWDGEQWAYLVLGSGQHFWDISDLKLVILDLTHINQPTIAQTIPLPDASPLIKRGRYLYMSSLEDGVLKLNVFDCINPLAPIKIDSQNVNFRFGSLVPFGDLFLLHEGNTGLLRIIEWNDLYPKVLHQESFSYTLPVWNGEHLFTFTKLLGALYIFRIPETSAASFFTLYK